MLDPIVKQAASNDVLNICQNLFGKPVSKDHRTLRYGAKGSLCVDHATASKGCFYDYERGSGGDVVDLVALELGSLSEALKWIEERYGNVSFSDFPKPREEVQAKQRWSHYAQSLWDNTTGIKGTPAERYLHSRGLHDPKSPDIRFLESFKGHKALACRITDFATNEPMSIQFFLVHEDGSKADPFGTGNKFFLGNHQTKGGVIRTCEDAEVTLGLSLAEGLESALSASIISRQICWSALNAGNLANLPHVSGIEEITIHADNDKAGRAAAEIFTRRMQNTGLIVGTVFPKAPFTDFNDWLCQ